MYSCIRLKDLVQWLPATVSSANNNIPIRHVSTDTRTLAPGDVFLCIRGENFDGHDYIDQAIQKGAVAVVSSVKRETSVPLLLVDDTLVSFGRFAKKLREQFKGPVVAITGSAGKSSTKEMTACLLGENTLASPASFNNLLGLSKTLCLVQDKTSCLVLEMGMNALGEIQQMASAFEPNIGLITNIGDAHVGRLGGMEGVFRAKRELFEYLSTKSDSKLALNLDDSNVVRAYRETFKSPGHVVTYSRDGKPADVRAISAEIDPKNAHLALTLEVGKIELGLELPIFGLHHAQNVAAAVALANIIGVPLEDIHHRLNSIRPALHRGEIRKLPNNGILIDESYNSNPTALRSSLSSLAHLDASARSFIILGEMRELDDFAEKFHRECGKTIVELFNHFKIPPLILGVGASMRFLLEEVKKASKLEVYSAQNVEEARGLVSRLQKPGDRIFIKGSRGVKLDQLLTLW